MDTVVATGWGNLEGQVTNGRIEWVNGSTWETSELPRIDGWFTFNGPGNPRAEIGQRNGSLEIVNENGGHSDGAFLDANTIVATDWGNLVGRLDVTPGKIEWANGSGWFRDLKGAWEYNGHATEIQHTGLSLTFINEHATRSAGHFVNIETVEADDDARSPVNTLTRTAARHYISPAFSGKWTLEQQAEDRWD